MEKFRKKLKLRTTLCTLLLVTGILLSIYAIIHQNQTADSEHAASFFNGYTLGTGFGVTCAALVTLVMNIRYFYNPKACEAKMLQENDERNRYISLKAWSITGYVMLYLLFVATFIVGIHMSIETATVLIYTLLLFSIVHCVSRIIVNKTN